MLASRRVLRTRVGLAHDGARGRQGKAKHREVRKCAGAPPEAPRLTHRNRVEYDVVLRKLLGIGPF